MLNKFMLHTTVLLLGITTTVTSHAYTVGQSLTVRNNTDTSMKISIDIPKSDKKKIGDIPAGGVKTIYMENGENGNQSGRLNETYRGPFTISDEKGNEMVQGQIVFFVSRHWATRYSFLDDFSARKGLSIDQKYYCQDEETAWQLSQKVPAFDNEITINGKPEGEGSVKKVAYSEKTECKGLKSSELEERLTFGTTPGYSAVCHDGRKTRFVKDTKKCKGALCHANRYIYTENGKEKYIDALINNLDTKNSMDELVGNVFCRSWFFQE